MKLLFEVSVCDDVDPLDMGKFITNIIDDLNGECKVKCLYKGTVE